MRLWNRMVDDVEIRQVNVPMAHVETMFGICLPAVKSTAVLWRAGLVVVIGDS